MKHFVILFLILLPVLSLADKNDLLFQNANNFYRQKNYEKAITLYDSILKSGYVSASLYFNKGNAYFKLQKYPLAILNYEKAKILNGNKDDIDFNIRYANQFITDKIEAIPQLFIFRIWDNVLNMWSSRSWAIQSIVFFWLCVFALSLTIWFRSIRLKRVCFVFMLVFLTLFIFTTLFSAQRFHSENSHNYAIVVTPTTSIKSAPDEESKELFIIHEGTKVQLYDKLQDWQKISLSDGKTGWIKIEDISVI
jgi:tetratricopeptide (TPR) repeat protein